MSKKIFDYFQPKPNLTTKVDCSFKNAEIKQEKEELCDKSFQIFALKTDDYSYEESQQKSAKADKIQILNKEEHQETQTKFTSIKTEPDQQFLIVIPQKASKVVSRLKVKSEKIKKEPKSSTTERPKCEFCKRDFAKLSKVREHIKSVHADKCADSILKCKFCTRNFWNQKRLDKHIKVFHPNGKVTQFQCDFDGKVFQRKDLLRCHMLYHLPNINCKICNLEMKVDSMRQHIRDKHRQDLTFDCKICKKVCKTLKLLKSHEKKHNKPFECDICGRKFLNRASVRIHKEFDHLNPKSFSCEICGRNFNLQVILKQHLWTHGVDGLKFNCKLCDFVTSDRKSFEVHRNFHKYQNQKFECDFDGKLFDFKEELVGHMNCHFSRVECQICHNFVAKRSIKGHIREVHGTNQNLKCSECSKVFKSEKYLKLHQKNHNKKFSCDKCDSKFGTNAALNVHIKNVHSDLNTVECPICGKKVCSARSLKFHLKIHDKNRPKPFKCQRCDFATDVRKSIKYHQKSHERTDKIVAEMKNPLKCQKCLKYFKNEKNLRAHVREVHPDKLFQCDLCGKYFKKKTYIRTHLRDFHKKIVFLKINPKT